MVPTDPDSPPNSILPISRPHLPSAPEKIALHNLKPHVAAAVTKIHQAAALTTQANLVDYARTLLLVGDPGGEPPADDDPALLNQLYLMATRSKSPRNRIRAMELFAKLAQVAAPAIQINNQINHAADQLSEAELLEIIRKSESHSDKNPPQNPIIDVTPIKSV